MPKQLLVVLLVLFIVYDTCRSFEQHLQMPLDGDIANIVLPVEVFKPAMSDPFAFRVLFHAKKYHAPNRAFAHWSMSLYYKTVPFVFQKFTSPVNSIYL